MARLFNNSRTIDSPQRAAALTVVLALHVGAVVALAQYQPAREAMSQPRAVIVSLITPPKLEPQQDLHGIVDLTATTTWTNTQC